jgi:TPR repeat protein
MRTIIGLLLVILCFLATPSWAEEFEIYDSLIKLAESCDEDTTCKIASVILTSSLEDIQKEAFNFLKLLALKGNISAQYHLGTAYTLGLL